MRVWTYPERKYEELGAVRWQASWEQVKKSAEGQDEIDPDCDIDYLIANFAEKAKAVKYAEKLIARGITAYGAVYVTRQVVDWFVEEDKVAEWADTSEREEVSS